MGVRCPGLEQCGQGPAEASQERVDGRRGGDEPESSHPSFVREDYREWWKAQFCGENQHWSGLKAIGDPPLYLAPMDFHLVKKASGGGEQVGSV